jgi:hypothetical protein
MATVKANDLANACPQFVHLAAVSRGFAELGSPQLARVSVDNGSAYMDLARKEAAAGNSARACTMAYASALAWRKKGDEMSTVTSLREAAGYARAAGVALESAATAPAASSTASHSAAPAPRIAASGTPAACAIDYSHSGPLAAACAQAAFEQGEAQRAAGNCPAALTSFDLARRAAQVAGQAVAFTLKTNDPIAACRNAMHEAQHPIAPGAAGLLGHYKCYFFGYQGLSLSSIGYIQLLTTSTYETTYTSDHARGAWRYEALPKNPANDIYGKLIFTSGPFAGHYAYANRKANGDRALIWPHNEREKPWDTSDTWCYGPSPA